MSGGTGSADFPTTPGAFDTTDHTNEDVWVAKLDAEGSTLVYSTLLGGSAVAGDFGAAIAVDRGGHAYVGGGTASLDFPSTRRSFEPTHQGEVNSLDAFVVKLKVDGSGLVFGSFLGGKCNDAITGIAVDDHENVVVTGSTVSQDFPTTGNAFDKRYGGSEDAFVAKLDADGSKLLDSTYLGGTAFERAQGIALDTAGNAYVTGWTTSSDFPTTRGAFDIRHNGDEDAFVAKLDAGGSKLLYSTYLGGEAKDRGRGIAVDTAGECLRDRCHRVTWLPDEYQGARAAPPGERRRLRHEAEPEGLPPRLLHLSRRRCDRLRPVHRARRATATRTSPAAPSPATFRRRRTRPEASAGGHEAFVVKLDQHGG